MKRVARLRSAAWPPRIGLVTLISLLGLLVVPTAQATQAPYEPNDTMATAWGPLANNSTYTAAIETENDLDYYYFYVTSESTSQVMITLKVLSATYEDDGAGFIIKDSHGTYLTGDEFVHLNDYKTLALSLTAGKYYVEVFRANDYGAQYSLTTSGSDGSFGEYAPIAAHCSTATAAVNTAQAALAKAQRKRRRARGRVARRRARRAVASANSALRQAVHAQHPWCFIPQ